MLPSRIIDPEWWVNLSFMRMSQDCVCEQRPDRAPDSATLGLTRGLCCASAEEAHPPASPATSRTCEAVREDLRGVREARRKSETTGQFEKNSGAYEKYSVRMLHSFHDVVL